uniref:Uncharacterized protein n=1 Tax=Magallana gigas TaxID=29159 RepID=A0A8W8MJS0_MAGGI
METRTVVKDGGQEGDDTVNRHQIKKTSRFKRRSELSVTSDDNPRQVYVIHLSAVLLNPRDCPQLVDFILDKPVIMVEIGVMINKNGKSCGPKKVIMDPEIDWDGLDITQQVPRRVSVTDGTARVYGVLSRSFNCQLENQKVTLNALLLGQKNISLTTDIQDDKEYSLLDVTEMFNCFMSENTGCTKKSSAIKKVSIASRNRRTSTEERDGKDGDSESRSSRLISAYLADDSYNAGKDIVRKVSIEEKVFKRPDKEKKVSTTVTEEEIRISPPEVSDDVPRRKLSNKGEKQRRSSEERKKKKEEKKGKNSKEEKFRRHSGGDQRIKNVRKVTPHCKIMVTEPGMCCSKEPCLSQLEEEDEGRTSMATDNSDHVYSSTCSLQRRISSSMCYSPGPGNHFDPITELSCEEDDGERKWREKQRSVSCT